jgi:hypothetical protein
MVEFAFSLIRQTMCISVAASRLRSLLVISALSALPMAAGAQRPAAPGDPLASQDSVVIIESVRVRTAPSPSSLSIDQVAPGTTLAIEAGSALGGPWIAVRYDERTAFVPREYVSIRMAPHGSAPVATTTPPAPPATSQPARVAVAVVDAGRPAPVKEAPAPVREAPAPVREAPAPVREAPAPVREAPVSVREAPTALKDTPASVRQAGTPTQTAARQPAVETPAPAQPAPQASAQDPSRFRRPALPGMVSVALLGSVTSYTVTASTSRVLHVSGHTLLTLHAFGWGVYAAPEFGAGAGHRSTMLGGGIMRDLLRVGPVHASALAGMTTYSEEPDGYYASSFVSRSIRAASGGALVSLPLIGPARLAYRVQYLRGLGDQSTFTQLRHAAGLQF